MRLQIIDSRRNCCAWSPWPAAIPLFAIVRLGADTSWRPQPKQKQQRQEKCSASQQQQLRSAPCVLPLPRHQTTSPFNSNLRLPPNLSSTLAGATATASALYHRHSPARRHTISDKLVGVGVCWPEERCYVMCIANNNWPPSTDKRCQLIGIWIAQIGAIQTAGESRWRLELSRLAASESCDHFQGFLSSLPVAVEGCAQGKRISSSLTGGPRDTLRLN